MAAPPSTAEALARAAESFRNGRFAEAESQYRKILQSQPSLFDALLMLGVVKAHQGEPAEAVRVIRRAIDKNPKSPLAHLSLGDALIDMGDPAAALASYDKAVAIAPGQADVHNNRATALRALGRHEEALAGYDLALKAAPNFVEACNNQGNLLAELGRTADAIESYDRALAIVPSHPLSWFGRGVALATLQRHEEAVASYTRAFTARPDFAEAWYNLANSHRALGNHEPALAAYDRAIASRPEYPEAFNNLGLLLTDLDRPIDAVTSYDRAIALRPNFADALYNRGLALRQLRRLDEALSNFETALLHNPSYAEAAAMAIDVRRYLCQWDRFEPDRDELERRVRSGQSVPPFITLYNFDDPELHLLAGRTWIAKQSVFPAAEVPKPGPYRHDRIRVAYVSGDFREHAVAYHLTPLIELHDRRRLEVFAISLARSDDSVSRRRLEAAFDKFVDVVGRTDREIANIMKSLEIDIAVDLMGHTASARPMVFAHRPAPVQVTYFGYPGTTGADFIDYIIADATIVRPGDEAFYTEQPVLMPDSYQMNEPLATRPDAATTRATLGLPEAAVVFCCFNQPYKITPDIFRIWMRLLRQVPDSVLWLYAGDPTTRRNLTAEAEREAIPASRLIFADPVARDQHLNRIGHADLFLDTFPYGAHATASDALRAGVPIVTRTGRSFPTRVCESLLRTVGVPELVTHSQSEYEALALQLANDPARLRALKQKIEANVATYPLFDAQSFARNIEAAYIRMTA